MILNRLFLLANLDAIFVTDSKYTKKILFISFYIVILQGNQWKEEMKKILVAEDTESNYLLLSII